MTPSDRAVALHAEATALCEAADHRRGAATARRALALFERHEGRHHPDVASTLLVLGRARELADDWSEARRCYERSDVILRRHARVTDPDLRRLRVKAARALCGVDRALGAYDRAAREGRRAVALARKWFGPRDLDLAGALNDLGMVRKYQGRFAEAPPLYRGALKILRAAGLGETADAASIFHNLGGIEHARGRYGRAEGPARRAVELRRRALGPRHPAVAADVAALAAIVQRRGRLEEATRLFEKALSTFRRVFGPRSYEVGVNLAGLGEIQHARARLADAAACYRGALDIHLRLFGARHVEVAMTMNNLALVWADQGNIGAARRMARRALTAFRASAGPRHPHTVACAKNFVELKKLP